VCVKGKMTKLPFPKTAHHDCKRPLEIVHSDVSGKAQVKTVGGGQYFVTFIDDFSRYVTVRVIGKKSDVFRCFREYQREVEAFHQSKISAFQTDNGGEYTGHEFENYLKSEGILHRKTVPRNPEQNGVAERANRTLVEMARCLMIQSSVPMCLWGEAINTACHIRNLCPSSAIGNKIPMELWKGERCDIQGELSRLRVFGCKVYYLISPSGKKFDSRADEGIFVGYDKEVKGYRIYLPKSRKVIISCHVRFEENVFPCKLYSEDTSPIFKRFADWIWDVDDVVPGENDDPEVQSDGEDEGGENDFFMENLINNEIQDQGEQENVNVENVQENVVLQNVTVPRKSARLQKPKTHKCCGNIAIVCKSKNLCISINVREALQGDESEKWRLAMEAELNSLYKKGVWDIVKRPVSANVSDWKWVLSVRKDSNRFKSRLVARGFWQKPGVDFFENEIFSPIVKRRSLRILLALCAENEWCYEHIDVESAYLNSTLDEDIYMEQPEFFETEGKDRSHYVCKLKKSLYGLKQSGRMWFKHINALLKSMKLKPCLSDPCVYVNESKTLIVAVYVDDMLVFGEKHLIELFKSQIKEKLDVRMLGINTQFLSVHLSKPDRKTVVFDQSVQVSQMLELFEMEKEAGVSTPLAKECEAGFDIMYDEPFDKKLYEQAVGHIMYAATVSRPDVACAIGKLSQKCVNPTVSDWRAVKRVFRYLVKTKDLKLIYQKTGEPLKVYCDSDFAGCPVDRKSRSGYVFILAGAAVSWMSKKQPIVSQSTCEAEYIAMQEAARETVWISLLLKELGQLVFCPSPCKIFCDNMGAISWSKDEVVAESSKHVQVRYFYVKNCVSENLLDFIYVESSKNVADILTKGLNREKTQYFVKAMGLV